MRFLSVCSGIEAASVAWKPLGWTCAGVSEIEAFSRSVLIERQGAVAVDWDHRHGVGQNFTPLFGDFTQIEAHHVGPIDLLVGGTPCQSFSIAGLRGGLDDERGNLALEYLRLADRTRPRWLVWENVPGVLSSNGGRDFGAILGGMAELGYGFAYRVLDAQFFGLAQRRRRVFVVGHLGSWQRAAAVLFERHSLQGHPAPRRKAGKVAPTIPSRSTGGGGLGTDFDCDGGEPFTIMERGRSGGSNLEYRQDGTANTILTPNGGRGGLGVGAIAGSAVRRLTPRECERLQGFPDDYTLVTHRGKPAADGPRYKALGNSMAVPVMAYLGERIQMVEDLVKEDHDGA